MSIQSQKKNMQAIHSLVSRNLSYIYGEKESGPNGAKKQFHTKSRAFLRALGNDLGFKEFKVSSNYGGIAVAGEITLRGIWNEDNGLYFQISQHLQQLGSFLYRDMKDDYSGGSNQWLDTKLFEAADYEEVLELLLALRKPVEATTEAESRDVA